ncbi:response regulator [Jannaschia ovalis]|uniref:Response regulator n=1 Tax=Jannaschia ovalis TaxID=3038773 RepID=A0ABY8L8R8_9RHOB|nr:response regulator [Jannaschia sp. GRR-S6-38]WGH77755.1 response regulator [Jannaschia sp. GRR-S6-38]
MLNDLNILIVEDEALLAMEVSMTLEDHGADIVGPYSSVSSALADCDAADAAVLDVDLCGEPVFPLADRLKEQGVPFIFHTGRADLDTLRRRYGEEVKVLPKPADVDSFGPMLARMVRRKGQPAT